MALIFGHRGGQRDRGEQERCEGLRVQELQRKGVEQLRDGTMMFGMLSSMMLGMLGSMMASQTWQLAAT